MQGFIVGALSLVGFLAGAFAGARLAPLLLSDGSASPYAPLFGLVGALLLGGLVASGPRRGRRVAARAGAHTGSGRGRRAARRRALRVRRAGDRLALRGGGAPDTRRARASSRHPALGGAAPAQRHPAALGPDAQRARAVRSVPELRRPGARRAAADLRRSARPGRARGVGSVVRVVGTACGLGIEGSGWVAGPNLVVTNAHVVAGEDDTQVEVDGRGPDLDATAVHVDPRNDVAVLRVERPGPPGAAGSPASRGRAAGRILGYPEDGPFRVRAARLGRVQTVLSSDAYGRGPVRRSVLPSAGSCSPATPAGRSSTPPGGSRESSSHPRCRVRVAATPCLQTWSAARSRTPRGPCPPGPARADSHHL